MTVLLAAQSPAKRAAKVSLVSAVSGYSDTAFSAKEPIRLSFGKVEQTLGLHHAVTLKKNWFLMTASLSLSIILFLCFSVGLDFAHELFPSLWSWQPDLTLNGYANEQVLNQSLMDRICSVSGVEQGELSEIYGDSNKVMTVSNKDNPFKVGDTVRIGGQEVEIVGALSDGVYSSEYSVICSQETFSRLTGKQNYSMIGIQLGRDASEAFTYAISGLVIGCGVGIMLSRFQHIRLLTQYFGTPWSLPTKLLIVVVAFDMAAAILPFILRQSRFAVCRLL